jgi:thiol:disulfide interchange protein
MATNHRKPARSGQRSANSVTPRPQMANRQRLIVFAVVALIGLVVAVAVSYAKTPVASSTVQASAQSSSSDSIKWIWNDPQAALALAKKENKPVLIDFWASWCSWCKKMDDETYPDPRVQAAMKNYIPLKIDVDKMPDFQKKFGVQGLPTSVIVDPNGKELRRGEGYQPADQFAQFLTTP